MSKSLLDFASRDEGASLIEYSLLTGLISVAIVFAVTVISGNLATTWSILDLSRALFRHHDAARDPDLPRARGRCIVRNRLYGLHLWRHGFNDPIARGKSCICGGLLRRGEWMRIAE